MLPLGPSISCQDAALVHLDSLPSHDLVIWTDGSVPLPFDKGGIGVVAKCSLCGTKATISFSSGPVCCSFFSETCSILQALCWSRQHQQICHFSFFSSTRALSSPPSFLLPQTLWQIWQELSFHFSFAIRLQWVPGHLFLAGKDTADELARRGAQLPPHAVPYSLYPLTSRTDFSLGLKEYCLI